MSEPQSPLSEFMLYLKNKRAANLEFLQALDDEESIPLRAENEAIERTFVDLGLTLPRERN